MIFSFYEPRHSAGAFFFLAFVLSFIGRLLIENSTHKKQTAEKPHDYVLPHFRTLNSKIAYLLKRT